MENELIKKQGWCGVSAVFRAERSSNSAEITAGMEEGDCGGETCLYQSFVSNLTGTQVFNRMWSQPHRTGWGSREQCQGCEGSEGMEPGLTTPALPLYLALGFLHCRCSIPQLSASSWTAIMPERIAQPWVWIYFWNLQEQREEQCPSLIFSLVCWGLPLLVMGSVIPQRQADLYTRYVQDKVGPHQLKRPDVIVFL